MAQELTCWSCGGSLAGLPLPFGRRAECPRCAASLHSCRQCGFLDRGASKGCREPQADDVVEKEQGNFCDYFQPAPGLKPGRDPAADAARAKLAAAFGAGTSPAKAAAAPSAPPAGSAAAETEAEAARRRLEAVFGKPKK